MSGEATSRALWNTSAGFEVVTHSLGKTGLAGKDRPCRSKDEGIRVLDVQSPSFVLLVFQLNSDFNHLVMDY